MHKKFEINRAKIKGGCQSGSKVVTHNSKSDLPLAILLEHMHTKFEINRTKIKAGCPSGSKVVTHNSKSDLSLLANIKLYASNQSLVLDDQTLFGTQGLPTRPI